MTCSRPRQDWRRRSIFSIRELRKRISYWFTNVLLIGGQLYWLLIVISWSAFWTSKTVQLLLQMFIPYSLEIQSDRAKPQRKISNWTTIRILWAQSQFGRNPLLTTMLTLPGISTRRIMWIHWQYHLRPQNQLRSLRQTALLLIPAVGIVSKKLQRFRLDIL